MARKIRSSGFVVHQKGHKSIRANRVGKFHAVKVPGSMHPMRPTKGMHNHVPKVHFPKPPKVK